MMREMMGEWRGGDSRGVWGVDGELMGREICG